MILSARHIIQFDPPVASEGTTKLKEQTDQWRQSFSFYQYNLLFFYLPPFLALGLYSLA